MRTHEKTGTDRTGHGNHLQVPRLHLLLEQRLVVREQLLGDITMADETAGGGVSMPHGWWRWRSLVCVGRRASTPYRPAALTEWYPARV